MLAQVSFSAQASLLRSSPRGPQLKPSTGGVGEQTLKNENGAMLVLPCASMLDTQAIGRGMMASRRTKYISSAVKSAGASEIASGATAVLMPSATAPHAESVHRCHRRLVHDHRRVAGIGNGQCFGNPTRAMMHRKHFVDSACTEQI